MPNPVDGQNPSNSGHSRNILETQTGWASPEAEFTDDDFRELRNRCNIRIKELQVAIADRKEAHSSSVKRRRVKLRRVLGVLAVPVLCGLGIANVMVLWNHRATIFGSGAQLDGDDESPAGNERPGTSGIEGQTQAGQGESIAPQQLRAEFERGRLLALLDIRDEREASSGRIKVPPGTLDISIPAALVPSMVNEIRRITGDRLLVVYSQSGSGADSLADWLSQQNLPHVRDLEDGFDGWSKTMDPEANR